MFHPPGQNGKALSLEKSTSKPSFYKLKNIHGQSVPLDKKADALAEYFRTTTLGVYPTPSTRQGRQERSSGHATTYQYRIHHDRGDT